MQVPKTIRTKLIKRYYVQLTNFDDTIDEYMGTEGNWTQRYGESWESTFDPEVIRFLDDCLPGLIND